jgi:hypothetical protein
MIKSASRRQLHVRNEKNNQHFEFKSKNKRLELEMKVVPE